MRISKDNPFYYLTSVANKRLPVFRTDKIKEIVANALDEARKSGGILIFAYVLMLDHYHLITDGSRKPSEVLRYTNGITARRTIYYLKENNFTSSKVSFQRCMNANTEASGNLYFCNLFLPVLSVNPFSRLCRLMCGKALPFRSDVTFFAAMLPSARRSLVELEDDFRKGTAFPHIGGHSPKESL